jgi:hypothetical protein
MSSWGILHYCGSAEYAEALAILQCVKSVVTMAAKRVHLRGWLCPWSE